MSVSPPPPSRASRQSINITGMTDSPDMLSKLYIERPESPQEQAVRLREQNTNMWFALTKKALVTLFVVVGVGIVLWYCMTIMWSPTASPDEKRWAQTILGSAVSAGLGYLIGKKD